MKSFTKEYIEDISNEVISKIAGPTSKPKNDQLEAVFKLLVDNRRTLVVQPTGWGKSAVYWIAATAVRRAGSGPVIVVSPLLALMRNQVESAKRAGLRAETLNSGNSDDWNQIESRLLANETDVLFVSPERLANPRFLYEILETLKGRLGLIVIDEAHCISAWGHDFRPTYQLLSKVITSNPNTPVLCTTATANSTVIQDIAAQLGKDTFVIRGSLTRESLQLGVVNGLSSVEQFAWVLDAVQKLDGSGIVYCLTTENVNRLAGFLDSQGVSVGAYHGQVDNETRLDVETKLMRNELKVVVATSALGMGYDKPDLAFCIHFGAPPSAIDYYQQVGRAGRSLSSAPVILLADSKSDSKLWEWFATSNIPKKEEMQAVLESLKNVDGSLSSVSVAQATRIPKGKAELLLNLLAIEDALIRDESGWTRTNRKWVWDGKKYEKLLEIRQADARNMEVYSSSENCLEAHLRNSLDDVVDTNLKCGRCSVCLGKLPAGLSPKVKQASLKAATKYLRGINNPIEPRKRWPKGISVEGVQIRNTVIESKHLMNRGFSVALGTDPIWQESIDYLFKTGELTDDLKSRLREILKFYQTDITSLVEIPSSRHQASISKLADFLSDELQVPVFDVFTILAPNESVKGKSQEARAFELVERISLRESYDFSGEEVLLVDDSCFTRWTLTLCSALLRESGASSVQPLTLQIVSSSSIEPD
jgi:ATP-dependent DNA helicase RecQ